MSIDTETTAVPSSISERRLAANRANAQLSTGPRTEAGKAISSLNAVKTGLCGRAVLLADEEEAQAYREHMERVFAWWQPGNVEEHALVQALADTQWRLESIPGLESALYAQARLRGEPLLQHADPVAQRLLWSAQAEVAEAKALKNLRLHERRLQRQYEKDKAELNDMVHKRWEREKRAEQAAAQRRQEEAEQQRRQEQAQRRAERKKARAEAAQHDGGFEFTNSATSQEMGVGEQKQDQSGSAGVSVLPNRPESLLESFGSN